MGIVPINLPQFFYKHKIDNISILYMYIYYLLVLLINAALAHTVTAPLNLSM